MKNMKEILEIVLETMRRKEDLMLLTVTETSGSVPRRAGAVMIVLKDGTTHGTIGGGKIEYTASQDALALLREQKSGTKHYTLRSEDAADLGMVCGGEVSVSFSYTDHSDSALFEKYTKAVQNWEENLSGTVYVFGGGHVAQELVPLLHHLDFRCVVFDDRSEFASETVFPDAYRCIAGDFERLSDYIEIQPEDYVCIMTRGHLSDYTVQKQVMKTPASYIGVMGSRRKTQVLREKLRADGFTDEELDRCKSPIGFAIHAETPAEIAVSIAAELIAKRADRH